MARALILICMIVVLAACGAATGPDLTGQQIELEQQLSGVKRAQTATASALERAATVEARATRQAIDQAAGTATAEAKQTAQAEAKATAQALAAQAAASATVQAHVFELTATADALIVAQHMAEATATADSQAILSAQQRQAATATAAAVDSIKVQAEQDAQHARQVSAVMAWILPAGMMLGIVAIIGLLFRLAAQSIDALHERWRLQNQRIEFMSMMLETRTGTVVFIGDPRAGYTPRLIGGPATVAPGDEFDASQVPGAQVIETLRVNGPGGTEFIARDDPADAQAESGRKLALRLLRDAIKQAGAQSAQIPTAKALGWQPNQWVRAVALLKPHVVAKQGRGGGTFLAGQYTTLMQLYTSIGERRTPLSTGGRSESATTLQ